MVADHVLRRREAASKDVLDGAVWRLERRGRYRGACNHGLNLLRGASIYILQCADGSYHTGITRRSVEERLSEHARGLILDCYTFERRPVKLVFAEHYERITDAIAAERRIKGWLRAKKEAYMRGDFPALVALSKRGSKKGA
jgi:putative endonuclease